ncbi:amidohydrolase family protein [Haloarchaeobius sp. HME9146]|uniref:metal-dependent hydrolase family protein n=1 Tax=Haloarchaeobius sp. HME9146 TaxID=2978732 RepID=UPI0021C13FAA|nr:amidohydrolase family protein [Haloarchaeobius sp. HME9146]MCT9097394.1 amidohydrolase family protein [Haloarchaeobius sp. HME9146]
MTTHVFRGGVVVDADGAREATVVVEDDRIVSIDPVDSDDGGADHASAADPDSVTHLDGAYLAPGLVDAHVHLMMDARPNPSANVDASTASLAYQATRNLRAAVETGVTTVRDLGAPDDIAIDARTAVDRGVLAGPRVQACGRNIVMTGGHGHWFGREADGPHEVRKAVREQLKAGADVVKCMATGGVLTEGAQTGSPELTPDELTALVDAASAKGVPTAAHAHGTQGIENAVAAGITSIEHGTYMDERAAEAMAEAGTYWVPTASAVHGIVDNADQGTIPEWAVEKGEHAQDAFADAFEHALAAGVTVAMGTDAGTPYNRFADIPHELELLVEYGMTPEEALEAATSNAAELLGIGDETGRVAPGLAADLVVLPADPREDVSAWQQPERVMARGRFVNHMA